MPNDGMKAGIAQQQPRSDQATQRANLSTLSAGNEGRPIILLRALDLRLRDLVQ